MSKFFHQVGPINHWQNSCAKHKKFTAYLTEELQLLRFDHQTCDWSTHELILIDWATKEMEVPGEEALTAKSETEKDKKEKKTKTGGGEKKAKVKDDKKGKDKKEKKPKDKKEKKKK